MPFPIFPFLFRKRRRAAAQSPKIPISRPLAVPKTSGIVRRHFYNERGFQTYGSFFSCWGGMITAGHVLSEAQDKLPPFARGPVDTWPEGLDAALMGCALPEICPPVPTAGQHVKCIGYPAGSRHIEERQAKIYLERPGALGQWIAHILSPDEPVVSGMSGGAVIDSHSKEPIGILITRNSPADLNNDRDPDESFDFISLASVWHALRNGESYV